MQTSIHRDKIVALVICIICCLAASRSTAQPVEAQYHTEAPPEQLPEADETMLNLSAGGTMSTGNTRSWQINTGGDFRLVRGVHAVSAMYNFIYGRADLPDDNVDRYQATARNFNGRLRYDHYLTPMDALFVAVVYRWDTFAGLDTRVQTQAGYMRNFILEEAMRVWGELGYDVTYDNYTDEVLRNVPTAYEEEVVHSARGFVGYDNHIHETLTFITGLEALVNVQLPKDTRINWDSALRSKLNGYLQVEMKFSLKYDHVPVPGTKNLDTLTQLNLIGTLWADGVEPATP